MEVVYFKFDTSGGQFLPDELSDYLLRIKVENDTHWYETSINAQNPEKEILLDSIYMLTGCNSDILPNGIATEMNLWELGTKKRPRIEHISFITKTHTANLENLMLRVERTGLTCKCIQSLHFSYDQGGDQFLVESFESRQPIKVDLKID